MKLPANTGSDFAPPPAGTHYAICYRVIDIGTQQVEWQGKIKHQRKVILSWELPSEKMDDGQPFSIHQRYTLSSSEKSRLRQDLESWRGLKFTEADFGPGGFDIKKLLGVPCLLNIVHAIKDDHTYANIAAIVKPPKGTPLQSLTNPLVYLDLDDFDADTFESLSEGLRGTIMKSPEYQEAISGKKSRPHDDEPPPRDSEHDGLDDGSDIPF